jgi:nicotinate-nucleotide pyrophosphorylase (carboxylating)
VERLPAQEICDAVRQAIAEDVGSGDVTTNATVPEDVQCMAIMRAREPIVLCGLEFALAAFQELSTAVRTRFAAKDGEAIAKNGSVLEVSGPGRALLTAERVALNFVQRLSGVATLASKFVEAVEGTNARILDTRKTTPGWRKFEKYAVACGGGTNHRMGLYDMVLIKDNHLVSLRDAKPNPVAAAVQAARKHPGNLKVEVEADTLDQVRQAVDAGADFVLLDNMTTAMMREAVSVCRGRALTEASGGVNLQTVRAIAEAGVDFISVGALTHSAPAVDIGLDFEMR